MRTPTTSQVGPAPVACRPAAERAVHPASFPSLHVEAPVPVTELPGGRDLSPALAVVGASGLLLVAWATTGSRAGAWWADLAFWSGILTLYLPIALRLLSQEATRRERLTLLVVLGLGLYLIKILASPLSFTYYDELQHWRTANDILQSGRLYAENPTLPASPLYPGLENVTTALVSLSNLSIFNAGLVVLGLARLVLVVSLYLFYEQASKSPRLAGIAALLYTANPNFVFFGAQFAYESLALPLATMVLFLAARRLSAPPASQIGLTVGILLGVGAVVITHHLTAYALVAALAFWTLVTWAYPRASQDDKPGAGGLALVGLVVVVGWLLYVATLTVGYLGWNLLGALGELLRLIAGEAAPRQMFRSTAGQSVVLWEQLTGYLAVAFILLGLPFGFKRVWRHYRANPVALLLVAGALFYPASIALRLTQAGTGISGRTSEFIFVAVAFVLAAAVATPGHSAGYAWRRSLILSAWIGMIFVGGVIVGWAPYGRLPGPYLVVADPRSVEPQGVAAAEWMRDVLGPGHRITGDRIQRLLMGSYGEQRTVPAPGERLNIGRALLSPELARTELEILRGGAIRYVTVDRRLSTSPPLVGIYFQHSEPGAFRHQSAMSPSALAKFDQKPTHRIFDSGHITIYDLEGLIDASAVR